jgi:hypothetical protein
LSGHPQIVLYPEELTGAAYIGYCVMLIVDPFKVTTELPGHEKLTTIKYLSPPTRLALFTVFVKFIKYGALIGWNWIALNVWDCWCIKLELLIEFLYNFIVTTTLDAPELRPMVSLVLNVKLTPSSIAA